MNGIMLLNAPYQIANGGHVSSPGMQTQVWTAMEVIIILREKDHIHVHVYRLYTIVSRASTHALHFMGSMGQANDIDEGCIRSTMYLVHPD